MKYFKTTETVTVDNYPYGRLQCKATFGLEFKPKKASGQHSKQSIQRQAGLINLRNPPIIQSL